MHPTTIASNDHFIAFKKGEEKGFNFFFNQLYPSLCLYALRFTNDRPVSEEMVSQAFIKIWQKHDCFLEAGHIKLYLYRTVRNDCLKWIQKKNREAAVNKEFQYLNRHQNEPAHFTLLMEAELMRQLASAIDLLPASCRHIFKLLYIEGWSTNQIARELNLSLSTVKTQKARGIMAIKKKFQPHLYALSS